MGCCPPPLRRRTPLPSPLSRRHGPASAGSRHIRRSRFGRDGQTRCPGTRAIHTGASQVVTVRDRSPCTPEAEGRCHVEVCGARRHPVHARRCLGTSGAGRQDTLKRRERASRLGGVAPWCSSLASHSSSWADGLVPAREGLKWPRERPSGRQGGDLSGRVTAERSRRPEPTQFSARVDGAVRAPDEAIAATRYGVHHRFAGVACSSRGFIQRGPARTLIVLRTGSTTFNRS